MTSKRSSRIYIDEATHHDDPQQRQMASAYISRRSSRNSLKDDAMQSVEEMEEGQKLESMPWESQTTSSRSQSMASNGKDNNFASTSNSRFSEKSSISMSSSSSISELSDYSAPAVNGQPLNFGLVVPGVYRSSYPKLEDYDFLKKLKLKTVVTLVKKEELDHELDSFVTANGINQVIFNMKGTKKEAIPMSTMRSILKMVLDRKNYPLLIHCNHGKHRTGCVVAAVRKLSGWQLNMVVDEYRAYAQPKVRDCDVDYINNFECAPLQSLYDLYCNPAQFSPVQVRSFFRILLFSTFVLVLWLVSGSRMALVRDNTALQ
ncbi:tyrosine-protein phosphatase siw14 [Conoideocrella luteorostrata]|uniref:diphosphoinositol-polyphosphate diphosphatase n=1 Tax=Conoideocrella luteorostrata TaxID=1105319 RepID=A0AAJ0CD05_9HYPO|nr:tyrosine-protein phosphatase siw14 [Conoideocrella luteorostrata]